MVAVTCCGLIGRKAFLCVALALFPLILGTMTALGQAAKKAAAPAAAAATNQSTVITADRLTFDYEKRYGVLEDNVHVVGREMSIDADTIVIRFREDNQITNIVATGNVSIKQGGGVATCSTARCDVVRGEMILTGNPALTRGEEMMKGEKITILREPGKKSVRVKCVGAPGSPTTLILSPGAKLDDIRLTGESDKK